MIKLSKEELKLVVEHELYSGFGSAATLRVYVNAGYLYLNEPLHVPNTKSATFNGGYSLYRESNGHYAFDIKWNAEKGSWTLYFWKKTT